MFYDILEFKDRVQRLYSIFKYQNIIAILKKNSKNEIFQPWKKVLNEGFSVIIDESPYSFSVQGDKLTLKIQLQCKISQSLLI